MSIISQKSYKQKKEQVFEQMNCKVLSSSGSVTPIRGIYPKALYQNGAL